MKEEYQNKWWNLINVSDTCFPLAEQGYNDELPLLVNLAGYGFVALNFIFVYCKYGNLIKGPVRIATIVTIILKTFWCLVMMYLYYGHPGDYTFFKMFLVSDGLIAESCFFYCMLKLKSIELVFMGKVNSHEFIERIRHFKRLAVVYVIIIILLPLIAFVFILIINLKIKNSTGDQITFNTMKLLGLLSCLVLILYLTLHIYLSLTSFMMGIKFNRMMQTR